MESPPHSLRLGGLAVGVALWPDDARSPVCLMLDDLTDGWIDRDGSGRPEGGNDWGHGLDRPGSAFHRLKTRFLDRYPEARATFFVPVDRLEDVRPGRYTPHFLPIDRRREFGDFLRAIDADPRLECAYHGRHHGTPGPTADEYLPEFAEPALLEDARRTLEQGKEIWRRVFDRDPAGGKFPAYAWGRHGEQAIDEAGFSWWCRRWDRDLAGACDPIALAPRFFGETPVVDVPSTLNGGLFWRPAWRRIPARKLPGFARHTLMKRRRAEAQLAGLLADRMPITIQNHFNQSRTDDLEQTPNFHTDCGFLHWLYTTLRQERVWHATCGEIAQYFEARSLAVVRTLSASRFTVSYADGRPRETPLSLCISGMPLSDTFVLRGDKEDQRARVSHRTGRFTCVTAPLRLPPGGYRIEAGAP